MQQQRQEATMRTHKAEGFGGHIAREGLGDINPRRIRRLPHRERHFDTFDDG